MKDRDNDLIMVTEHLNSRAFWLGTLDRGLKSLAQTLVALFGASAALLHHMSVGVGLAFGGAVLALSVISSVVSGFIGDPGTTSAIRGGR